MSFTWDGPGNDNSSIKDEWIKKVEVRGDGKSIIVNTGLVVDDDKHAIIGTHTLVAKYFDLA